MSKNNSIIGFIVGAAIGSIVTWTISKIKKSTKQQLPRMIFAKSKKMKKSMKRHWKMQKRSSRSRNMEIQKWGRAM